MSKADIATTLKELYALYGSDTQEAIAKLLSVLDENVRWCSLADGCSGVEFTRERNGPGQVQQYFQELTGDWEMIHFTVEEFVCENDRVVMIGSCGWKHKATGKTIDTPKVDLWKIKGEKIIEFRELYDTAMMIEAVR
jgi:ketosteroid isomerase-like protein